MEIFCLVVNDEIASVGRVGFLGESFIGRH